MKTMDFEAAKSDAETLISDVDKGILGFKDTSINLAQCYLSLLEQVKDFRETLEMLMKFVPESHYEDCAYLDDPDSDEGQCNCGVYKILQEAREVLNDKI